MNKSLDILGKDNLIGKKFGEQTVISYAGNKNGSHFWDVQCSCGSPIRSVRDFDLKSGRIKTCGRCQFYNPPLDDIEESGYDHESWLIENKYKVENYTFYSKEEMIEIIRSSKFKHYIYILFTSDGIPFYVGEGTRKKDGKKERFEEHEMEARNSKKSYFKLNEIKKHFRLGKEIKYTIDSFHSTQKIAFKREEELVPYIGRRNLNLGPLTNLTNGGDGVKGDRLISDEERKKRSQSASKPRPWQKGRKTWNNGISRTEDEKEAIKNGIANKSDEKKLLHRQRLSDAKKGKPGHRHSDKTKEKCRENAINTWTPPDGWHTVSQVAKIVGTSKSSIVFNIREGHIPQSSEMFHGGHVYNEEHIKIYKEFFDNKKQNKKEFPPGICKDGNTHRVSISVNNHQILIGHFMVYDEALKALSIANEMKQNGIIKKEEYKKISNSIKISHQKEKAICPSCETEFEKKNKRQKYCSQKCSQQCNPTKFKKGCKGINERIIQYKGKDYRLCDLAKEYNINVITLHSRLKTMSVEDAVETPLLRDCSERKFHIIEYQGVTYKNASELARYLNLNERSFLKYLNKGKSIDEIIYLMNNPIKVPLKIEYDNRIWNSIELARHLNLNERKFYEIFKKTNDVYKTISYFNSSQLSHSNNPPEIQ